MTIHNPVSVALTILTISLVLFLTWFLYRKISRCRFERIYKRIFDQNDVVMLLLDLPEGKIVHTNAAACNYYGYSYDSLVSMRYADLCEKPSGMHQGIDIGAYHPGHHYGNHCLASGEIRAVEIKSVAISSGRREMLCSLVQDISELKRNEETKARSEKRTRILLELSHMVMRSPREIAAYALEAGIALTGSKLGYIAFTNSDESVLTMQYWSKTAMEECSVIDKPIVYSVEQTGLWGEAIRQRKPIISNDYDNDSSCSYKKGTPAGHVKMQRVMNIPLFDGEHIVAVFGVANKEEDYLESDAMELTLLMEGMWRILKRKEVEEALEVSEEKYRALYEASQNVFLALAAPEWKFTAVNHNAVTLFRARDEQELLTIQPWVLSPEYQPDGELSSRKAMKMIEAALEIGSHYFEWTHRKLDGEDFPAMVLLTRMEFKGQYILQAKVEDITGQKQMNEALKLSEERFKGIADSIPGVVYQFYARSNGELGLRYMNRQVESLFGIPIEPLSNCFDRFVACVAPEHRESFLQSIRKVAQEVKDWDFEGRFIKPSGEEIWFRGISKPIQYENEIVFNGVIMDTTLHRKQEEERKQIEFQLQNAQKLESIGRLAAGIAHEINTPSQFVGDNIKFLKDSFLDLLSVLNSFEEMREHCRRSMLIPEKVAQVDEAIMKADLAYLSEEIPRAVEQSLEGMKRISRIVRAMKEFSHPDRGEKIPTDLNRAIENTITVARNEWKYVAQVQTEFSPTLPLVNCYPGQINQVILNLVINAAHAIGDKNGGESGDKGLISVHTHQNNGWVEIEIADNGAGIPEEIHSKIFDPFFTTKEVGKGTGQGLAIVYNVVVKQHGGTVSYETEEGKGTTFIIRLPVLETKSVASSAQVILP